MWEKWGLERMWEMCWKMELICHRLFGAKGETPHCFFQGIMQPIFSLNFTITDSKNFSVGDVAVQLCKIGEINKRFSMHSRQKPPPINLVQLRCSSSKCLQIFHFEMVDFSVKVPGQMYFAIASRIH
jgi:hypothetical protein